VFELPLVAVINQVHAGVDVPVLDLRVRGNNWRATSWDHCRRSSLLLPGNSPTPATAGAGLAPRASCAALFQRLFRLDKPGLAGNSMLGVRVCLSEHEHRLGGGQEQGIAAAAGEELDLWFGLPLVCLEAQWQLPVGSQDLRLGRLRALGRWMRR